MAAVAGLAKLNRDDAAEKILRAVWTNPKEAYGARKNALRGLVAWKVKDADLLLAEGLKVSADHHTIASTALDLMLETPGAKSRELAALYSKYGQPESLRASAIGAFRASPKTTRLFRTSWLNWLTITTARCGFRPGTRCAKSE